ncbi:hypothetical protein R6138_04462 [Ralstonia thomasii]|uniref:DUF551 domain-containing protein n=1 Tax=Ralstonia thomasii TaxID=3058596 RepID=UPI0028F62E34|nr:DUF551 domain-containing protein [Ralstonia sp. LMG 18095]CAJ0900485.1 hypothetical protein R6138_04462 [Ralstonia sp. LMG 18095]
MDEKTIAALREVFEAKFPIPRDCIWTGKGYAATAYGAWNAHKHIDRWEGFLACYQHLAPMWRLAGSSDQPKAGVKVIAWHEDYGATVIDAEFLAPHFSEYTHWMPLPAAPAALDLQKEKQDAE